MNRGIRGAAAGAAATLPMTAVMIALHRRLPRRERYPLPPALVVGSALRKADIPPETLSPRIRLSSVLVSHFAYGAGAGAACSLLAGRRAGNPLFGAACGAVLWAAGYVGWIPMAGLMRRASEEPARRNALMLAAHVVWGGCLAALLRRSDAGSSR